MFSSDKHIQNIGELVVELKHYFELRTKHLQIDIVSKLSRLLAALVLGMVLFLFFSVIVIFASLMLSSAIARYTDSSVTAHALIAVFYILLGVLIYLKRHTWIEGPIVNFVSHLFFDKPNDTKSQS